MLPVFRSRLSVLSFCGLMLALLSLPLLTAAIGHPSREQAYDDMSTEAGPLSFNLQEIFHDRRDADVLFLGSSLVQAAVDRSMIERSLSAQLGRPAHVVVLALNWQGLDEQYFLLRDYLQTHHARLIVWNLPVPGSRNLQPHVQAFHFVRYGEDADAFTGLSPRYRLALYGDMVLGAPRELLSHLRPNRLSPAEKSRSAGPMEKGYYGAPFTRVERVRESSMDAEHALEMPPYAGLVTKGKPLNDYEMHFARKIVSMVQERGSTLALIHIPIDEERGMQTMPERGRWSEFLDVQAPMIGVSSATLFENVPGTDFNLYYFDQHLNANGSELFTASMLPAILQCYRGGENRTGEPHE